MANSVAFEYMCCGKLKKRDKEQDNFSDDNCWAR